MSQVLRHRPGSKLSPKWPISSTRRQRSFSSQYSIYKDGAVGFRDLFRLKCIMAKFSVQFIVRVKVETLAEANSRFDLRHRSQTR